MKVGIITIIGYLNYGNRLQNYAVQETLKKINVDSETIYNELKINKKDSIIKKVKKSLENYSTVELIYLFNRKVKQIFKKNKINKLNELNNEKKKKLMKFTEENIKQSEYKIIGDSIPENLNEKYEYFVVGSDQVWNPYHRHGNLTDFLNFTETRKKIAYSASFGIDELPTEYSDLYAENLKTFNNISVREESGLQIVKKLTGKSPTVLVDPTMMLNSDEWGRIMLEDKNKPKSKFLLTYVLGEIDTKKKQIINKLVKKYDLEVVNLARIESEEYYTVGPEQFLDYINSCFIFITDSFHGVVFSIIFQKNFIVFSRGNMNSRIETLLSKFNLEDRFIDRLDLQNVLSINFSETEQILKLEQEKAYNFIKNALNQKE